MRVVERPNNDLTPVPSEEKSHKVISEKTGPIVPRRSDGGYVPPYPSVTRRPPKLPLAVSRTRDQSEIDRLISPDIKQISSTATLDMAFAVSELAYRLENPVRMSGDADAVAGLETLSRTAKMFEHLLVLQNEEAE